MYKWPWSPLAIAIVYNVHDLAPYKALKGGVSYHWHIEDVFLYRNFSSYDEMIAMPVGACQCKKPVEVDWAVS